MASFRFRQRQVADPLAQENFEQLEGDLPKNWLQLAVPLAAGRKIAFGPSPGFNWSGGIHTVVTVAHGLGVTPQIVVPGSARPGDALADDARAPWLTTTQNFTSTTFDLIFSTKNNGTIGVFAVGAGACYWIAIG
jgi:hypothetical protein